MTDEELKALVKVAGGDLVGIHSLPHTINEKLVAMYVVETEYDTHRFFTTDHDDAAQTIIAALNIRS